MTGSGLAASRNVYFSTEVAQPGEVKPTQCVVIGDIGCQSTDERWGTGILIELSEQLGGRGQVSRPAEPASVTCIQVHVDASSIKLLESVDSARLQNYQRGAKCFYLYHKPYTRFVRLNT